MYSHIQTCTETLTYRRPCPEELYARCQLFKVVGLDIKWTLTTSCLIQNTSNVHLRQCANTTGTYKGNSQQVIERSLSVNLLSTTQILEVSFSVPMVFCKQKSSCVALGFLHASQRPPLTKIMWESVWHRQSPAAYYTGDTETAISSNSTTSLSFFLIPVRAQTRMWCRPPSGI